MYEDVIEEILENLDREPKASSYPKFSGEGYKSYKIEIKNFHKISKQDANRKVAFVDGGNADIISSSNFSLNLVNITYA